MGMGVRDSAITGLTITVGDKHLQSVFHDTNPRRTVPEDQHKKVPQAGTQQTAILCRREDPAPGVQSFSEAEQDSWGPEKHMAHPSKKRWTNSRLKRGKMSSPAPGIRPGHHGPWTVFAAEPNSFGNSEENHSRFSHKGQDPGKPSDSYSGRLLHCSLLNIENTSIR